MSEANKLKETNSRAQMNKGQCISVICRRYDDEVLFIKGYLKFVFRNGFMDIMYSSWGSKLI